jgi:hypothetical protein
VRPAPRAHRRPPATALACALLLAACGGGGDAIPVGQAGEVSYTDTATSTTTTLAVTVDGLETGTIEELEAAGLSFDEDERSLVPHYLTATYTNTGDAEVERTMRLTLEDADGGLISPTVVLDFAGDGGQEGPCPDVGEGPLPPGESFSDCTLFLVPEDLEPARASFLSQPAEGEPDFVLFAIP